MREEHKFMNLDLKGEEDGEGRERHWNKYIGERAGDRGIELKALKEMALDRDQCRKWINIQTLKGNRGWRRGRRRNYLY
jgi:hypothetical protein